MGIGAQIGWTAWLFLVGAIGLGLLKDLYGHGLHRAIWGTLIFVAMLWIWARKTLISTDLSDNQPAPQLPVLGHECTVCHTQDDKNLQTNASVRRRWDNKTVAALIRGGSACVALGVWLGSAGAWPIGERTLRCDGTSGTTGTVHLVIKTGWLATPTINLHYGNSTRSFEIVETNSTLYRATDHFPAHASNPDPESASDKLSLDRIVGSMKWRSIVFQKGPPDIENRLCTPLGVRPEYCESWAKGTYSSQEYQYACQVTAAKF